MRSPFAGKPTVNKDRFRIGIAPSSHILFRGLNPATVAQHCKRSLGWLRKAPAFRLASRSGFGPDTLRPLFSLIGGQPLGVNRELDSGIEPDMEIKPCRRSIYAAVPPRNMECAGVEPACLSSFLFTENEEACQELKGL